MAEKVITSEQYSLEWRDALNGLIYAGAFSALTALQQAIDANNGIDWKIVGYAALSGIVTHFLRSFLSKPKVITTYKSNEQAVSVAEDIKESNK